MLLMMQTQRPRSRVGDRRTTRITRMEAMLSRTTNVCLTGLRLISALLSYFVFVLIMS